MVCAVQRGFGWVNSDRWWEGGRKPSRYTFECEYKCIKARG